MRNLYEVIKDSLHFNKFIIDDLVCVEYTCPLEDQQLGLFTEHDYIIYVLSGSKSWKTIHGEWKINTGETLYVKKGASIITQFFEEDFCMLGFFLPDQLIRESLQETDPIVTKLSLDKIQTFTASQLKKDNYLDGFFNSMLHYFRNNEQPADSIIILKLKELLLNLMYKSEDKLLISYLNYIKENSNPALTHIMESNFCYNLNIEQFARMCHRSLSTFKRDFHNHYDTTPGKWLLSKRLDFAANMLLSKNTNISQVAFESGFEDISHFSRVFKDKFSTPPSTYRKDRA
jgi:AraC-like DNA-binding protein